MDGRKKRGWQNRIRVPVLPWMLYILYITYTSSWAAGLKLKGNKIGNDEEFQFEALQCDNAHTLARYSSKQFCNGDEIKGGSGVVVPTDGGEYAVIQHSANKYFEAVLC